MSKEGRAKTILDSCLSKAVAMDGLIDYAGDSIVSKTILDCAAGTITLFAFDAGQKLSTHQAPFDAFVQVVEGSAAITIGDESLTACAGQIVVMPANVPHSVAAEERFKMLLTMIRG